MAQGPPHPRECFHPIKESYIYRTLWTLFIIDHATAFRSSSNAVNSHSHQMYNINIIHKYWSAKVNLGVNCWL